MKRPRCAAVLFSLAALLSTAACAPVTRSDPFVGPGQTDEVLLTVHNHDTRNANIYAYWNGLKDRVGTVIAMQSETFTIRWRNEQVQLGIEFLGTTAGYRTESIEVTQGDHLDYVILAGR